MKSLASRLENLASSQEFKEGYKKRRRLMIFAEKLYGRRKDLSMSQSELAEKAGTKQRIISQLENATYGYPGIDLITRISEALEIQIDYLLNENIDRKTCELYSYFLPKVKKDGPGMLQMIKIPYFIDLESIKQYGKQISNFCFVRYDYGPFDTNLYRYAVLENKFNSEDEKGIKITTLSKDDLIIIDAILKVLPVDSGLQLKTRSYETKPMKKMGATMRNRVGYNQKLDMFCVTEKD